MLLRLLTVSRSLNVNSLYYLFFAKIKTYIHEHQVYPLATPKRQWLISFSSKTNISLVAFSQGSFSACISPDAAFFVLAVCATYTRTHTHTRLHTHIYHNRSFVWRPPPGECCSDDDDDGCHLFPFCVNVSRLSALEQKVEAQAKFGDGVADAQK